jgi:uncharacterized RDD family membrane protein YckC
MTFPDPTQHSATPATPQPDGSTSAAPRPPVVPHPRPASPDAAPHGLAHGLPGQGYPNRPTAPGHVYPAPAYGYPPPGHAYPPPGFGFPPPPPPVAPGGAPLADIGERFLAHLIDAVILMFCNFIPIALALFLVANRIFDAFADMTTANDAGIQGAQVHDPSHPLMRILLLELILVAILLPLTLVISYLYMVTYMSRTGQTVGKRVMKLKIVSAIDGSSITRSTARKRWLVAQPASLIGPYFTYADSLWLLWDKPYRQCLHDKCAETVVVKLT